VASAITGSSGTVISGGISSSDSVDARTLIIVTGPMLKGIDSTKIKSKKVSKILLNIYHKNIKVFKIFSSLDIPEISSFGLLNGLVLMISSYLI
jgi:hypothetical protein